MPQRLVDRDALHDLVYPYDEEEDCFLLRVALEKDQIDEVIRIRQMYKAGEQKTVHRYDEKVDVAPILPCESGHEKIIQKEYSSPLVQTEWHPPSPNKFSNIRPGSSLGAHSGSKRASTPSSKRFEPPMSTVEHRKAPMAGDTPGGLPRSQYITKQQAIEDYKRQDRVETNHKSKVETSSGTQEGPQVEITGVSHASGALSKWNISDTRYGPGNVTWGYRLQGDDASATEWLPQDILMWAQKTPEAGD